MNKKVILFMLCFIILLGLCGCGKTENKSNVNIKEKETIDEKQTIESMTETSNKNETSNKIETSNKNEISNKTKTSNKNETNNNKTEENNSNNNNKTPSVNKKVAVCTKNISGTGYNASEKYTVTFENDSIVYFTIYTIKSFIDDYKAENDSWTLSNMESLKNNNRKGLSGNIYIENNTTYMTINYDTKMNPSLLDLLTSHRTYDDFISYSTSQGMSCK